MTFESLSLLLFLGKPFHACALTVQPINSINDFFASIIRPDSIGWDDHKRRGGIERLPAWQRQGSLEESFVR